MATEYYIVKPDKKEVYYLGKGNWGIIEGFKHSAFMNEFKGEYLEFEDYEDLFIEILKNDYYSDCYVEQVRDLAYNIFEWCDSPVYIENDCSDSYNQNKISDYTETGSILEVWKEFKDKYQNLFYLEEQIDDILNLIPSKYWIKNENNVLLSVKTIVEYIKEKESDNDKR